jgi:hypothetical protein
MISTAVSENVRLCLVSAVSAISAADGVGKQGTDSPWVEEWSIVIPGPGAVMAVEADTESAEKGADVIPLADLVAGEGTAAERLRTSASSKARRLRRREARARSR